MDIFFIFFNIHLTILQEIIKAEFVETSETKICVLTINCKHYEAVHRKGCTINEGGGVQFINVKITISLF